jgi:carbon monoxide dehydrogenase subunit G
MLKIEGEKVNVACSSEECFTFLSNLNNYNQLLPKNKISNWESEINRCSFKIQSAYKLELIYQNSTPHSSIILVSGDSSPIKFTMDIILEQIEDSTSAQIICNAKVNPVLKMMIEKPLKNLFDYMADRLIKVMA